MGIEWNTLKFLLACRQAGVHFTHTLTLGRQTLFVGLPSIRMLFKRYGALPPEFGEILEKGGNYAEGIFKLLGAEEVTSIDKSDFEGASVVHDMNVPLPMEHNGRYEFVFDGGTLEHIFHFPIALRSSMEAVKIGGHLLLHTPANNYCGHGFYQLSPELYYRALSNKNGFEIVRMIAFEAVPGAKWYDVVDPAIARQRVEIAHGKQRVLLLVLAKRVRETEIFKTAPQQSDYFTQWNVRNKSLPDAERSAFAGLRNAWSDGRLAPFVQRCLLNVMRSNGMIHMHASRLSASIWSRNRHLSMKAQSHLFHPTER
jgi:hypothetical protein